MTKTEITNKIIYESKSDIYHYPDVFNAYVNASRQLTIGDLHANTIKLLYILVKENILLMDKFAFEQLVKIYRTIPDSFDNLAVLYRDAIDDNGRDIFFPICQSAFEEDKNNPAMQVLQTQDLLYFKEILYHQTKINTRPNLIRLLGDELADRGNNDLLTIFVLEFLITKQFKLEILLSNHNIQFIYCYELQKPFLGDFMRHFQSASLSVLQILLNKKMVAMEEVQHFINTVYKPNLKLLSYTLDTSKNHMTIFSHAAIGMEIINAFCKKFNVAYHDETAVALANTIEKINEAFSLHLKNNTVHTLFDLNSMFSAAAEYPIDINTNPIEFILWNRSYEYLTRPKKINAYEITFVHGHDVEETESNIIGLDNKLGKRGRAERLCPIYNNEQEYTVLVSTEKALDVSE